MAFQFSLESLLRLRRSQQRQQEVLVQRESDRIGQLSRELKSISNEMSEISVSSHASTGVRAAELHFDDSRMQTLAARLARTEQLLQQAEERRKLLAAELHNLWQQREVLESVRQNELQGHALEEGRREQRRQDDLFQLQRRKR